MFVTGLISHGPGLCLMVISDAPSWLRAQSEGEKEETRASLVHIPGKEDWELVCAHLGPQGIGLREASQWEADFRERVLPGGGVL